MEKVEKFYHENVGSSRFGKENKIFRAMNHLTKFILSILEKTNGKWQILEDENIENQRKIVINTIQ